MTPDWWSGLLAGIPIGIIAGAFLSSRVVIAQVIGRLPVTRGRP